VCVCFFLGGGAGMMGREGGKCRASVWVAAT
jgi:hypothetical protein